MSCKTQNVIVEELRAEGVSDTDIKLVLLALRELRDVPGQTAEGAEQKYMDDKYDRMYGASVEDKDLAEKKVRVYRTTKGGESYIVVNKINKLLDGSYKVDYETATRGTKKQITIPADGVLGDTKYDVQNLEDVVVAVNNIDDVLYMISQTGEGKVKADDGRDRSFESVNIRSNYDMDKLNNSMKVRMNNQTKKVLNRLKETKEFKGSSSYRDALVSLVMDIKKPTVTYDELLAFSKTTAEMVMEGNVTILHGQAMPKANKVVIAKEPNVEQVAEDYLMDWYLVGTDEGARISGLDESAMYKALARSSAYKDFVDTNKQTLATSLLKVLRDTTGSHTLAHEMIHIGVKVFMDNSPDHELTKKMNALYDEVLGNRAVITRMSGTSYWESSIDEFIAEGLTNPNLIKVLSQTKSNLGTNRLARVFTEFIDTALSMLGIKKTDSVYEHLLDGFTAMLEAQKSSSTMSLGSKVKSKATASKFDRIENTIHGNVTKMQELLEELHNIGGTKADPEHLEYLKSLIGKMNPKFFKKMKTYIDTKAKESHGIMNVTNLELHISKAGKLAGNQQSEAEIYTHEVVHSYVAFALEAARKGNVEARKLLRELENTMQVAREKTSWRNFLPEVSIDPEIEEKNAKDMYEYIFNSEHAEDEFIAHVLTNPYMMKRTQGIKLNNESSVTLWEKVKNLFGTLVDLVSGNYEFNDRKKNVFDMTMSLTFRLAEYNNKAIREAKANESVVSRLVDKFNAGDTWLGEELEAFSQKWMPKGTIGKKPDSVLGAAKWYAEALGKMVLNPVYRRQLSKWATAYGMPPEGSIQTIMRDFTEQDDLAKVVDWIGLASDRIDGGRMDLIGTVKSNVETGFKTKLSKDQKKALTRVVLDTDLSSIYKADKSAELRKLLTDEDALNTAVSRAKYRLKELDEKRYNWHTNQATGLGYFMATGKAHIAQNFNAFNIARGLLSTEYKSPSKKLVDAIDEVATLVALQYTGKVEKTNVAELIRTDTKGFRNLIGVAKGLKVEAGKTVFAEDKTHVIKGYSKEVFDDRITMEVARVGQKKEMEHRGFKLVKTLDKHSGDTSPEQFGMYVSEMFSGNEWYRTATRLTKLGSKGTNLKDLYYANEDEEFANIKFKTNKTKLDVARTKLVTKMIKGEITLDDYEYGMAPIMNESGSVVDYRYVMDKESKEGLLGMSTDVADVMARTRAHTYDKYESTKHNDSLLDVIKKDMEDNYIPGMTVGRNDMAYTLISEDSSDPKIAELWTLLPKSFKQEGLRNNEKGIAVRSDLLNNYFGYRHLSITNFPLLGAITPEIIKGVIKMAETLWMEFIKITKVDVLIKMPFVMVGNVISNFMYSVMTGTNPVELLRMYRDSTRDVRDYLKKHRELIKLQEAKASGNVMGLDVGKIGRLVKELENNPIHELYQLGVYQAIVEDVSKEDFTSTNKLKQWYKDKTEGVPQVIKDGMNWVYLTEETQYYKFMTEVLQMSDLVARDVENRKLKLIQNNQINGKAKLPKWFLDEFPGDATRKLVGDDKKEFIKKSDEMRRDVVLNAFINYNKPSGAIEEYLNKVGLIMFTKYAKRIQRVVATTGAKYPIKSLMMLLGQEFIMDVETIQDQSVFTRSWYNMGLSENDLIPGKPMWEYLMEVFTPPILQGSTYKLI